MWLYVSILTYIGAVELSAPVTFPSVAVLFEDFGSVVELNSLSGVVVALAIAADVKVPTIKEAVARILAIAKKVDFIHAILLYNLYHLFII